MRHSIAVEEAAAFLGMVVAISTEHGGNLQLNLLVQDMAGQLADQLPSGAAIKWRHRGAGARCWFRHCASSCGSSQTRERSLPTPCNLYRRGHRLMRIPTRLRGRRQGVDTTAGAPNIDFRETTSTPLYGKPNKPG